MTYPINKKVIIRTNRAGVFYGTLAEYDDTTRTAEIHQCRRIWYWEGACSLSQLAVDGTARPSNCKFTVTVGSIQVMEVIEIIPCSEKASKSIESVMTWKS
jgi:hypothetical protein